MSHYLVCSISGKPTSEPVVSILNGRIFERSTLAKHIEIYGTCPVSNSVMTHEDYVSVNGQTAEEPFSELGKQTVHQLVDVLRNDYDNLAIENYTMRKYIDELRKQLSHSLYQNDASQRVVARLIKERDEARTFLSTLKSQGIIHLPEEVEEKSKAAVQYIPQNYITKIQEKTVELNTKRKANKKMKNPFVNFVDLEQISNYGLRFDESVAASTVSSVDYDSQKGSRVLVLSHDHTVSVLNLEFKKIEGSLKTKNSLTSGFFVPSLDNVDDLLSFITTDNEGLIQHYQYNTSNHKFTQVFEDNLNGKITQLRRHPIGNIVFGLIGASEWFMYDVQYKKLLHKGYLQNISNIAVHPDGHIIGLTDCDNKVGVDKIAFSENGYQLAVASSGQKLVEIWDLRGQKQGIYKTLEFEQDIDQIEFDITGKQFLVVAQDVYILEGKKYKTVARFQRDGDKITSIQQVDRQPLLLTKIWQKQHLHHCRYRKGGFEHIQCLTRP